MGVITEIGIMRCVVVVLLSVSAWGGGAEAGCPSLCSCRGGKPEPEAAAAAPAEPPPGEPLRLRCGPSPAQITELKEIDFTNISASVISLNMSGNAISVLSRDLHLPNLQKLDLSRNQISLIESDAFYNVSSLQRLDLSHNQISTLSRDMFKGLASLERLLLAHNLLRALPPGTFDHLVALKLLDITENQLACECALVWLGGWLTAAGARLAGGPRCAAPVALAGKPLRKLRNYLDLAQCGAGADPQGDALVLRPARDQLVFAGDALELTCSAPLASALYKYELRWSHPSLETCDVNVTSSDVQDEGVAETVARLPNVSLHHAGDWTCRYSDERRVARERTVTLVVLTNETRSCPTGVTADNKGLYSWPQLLLNRTAAVPCRAGAARATRVCRADGTWAPADTSQCAYVANVTKLLQQFALLDPSLARYSALNATRRLAALLRAHTFPLADVRDPDDVMFVARAVRNYMQYLPEERELGSALLDVISAAMNVTPSVMAAAEARHGACSQLARAAEDLAAIPSDKQKWNFAVESFPVRAGWGGATCVWYSAGGGEGDPRLHCTTTNRTVARLLTFSDAHVHASVQIPASLVFALERGRGELAVLVFRDAALFPLLPALAPADAHRAKDYYGRSTKREDLNMEITSPVVSVQLHNGSLAGALPEPVVGTLRAAGCGGSARAAVWDPRAHSWLHNDTQCRVLHYAGCTAVVALAAPGACALLARAERGIFGARTHGARFKASHPAVYVGSLVLGASLAAAALTYAAAFPALLMPRRAKHAHLNTWLALAALCLLYALGVYQTEDARLCRALGLALHYLSLAALLWQCVAAHVLYRAVLRARRPREPEAEPAPAPPVLGLYLAGWGIALIVVGISGAVNLQEYAGYAQCFLSSAGALGALLVPGALLLLFLCALLLLTRCAARRPPASEGTQATEHVDLELWDVAPPVPGPGRSPSPRSDADWDAERAPLVQLRAQAAVLALYLATWASAASAVYRPLPAYLPYQEDICSILYAVCATVLGTFVLFFYGIARSDVRAQWALMRCYLRRRRRCCRGRSVCAAPARVPGDNRARPASRASGTDSLGKGAELNGREPLKHTNGNGKADINLVVLHRQQYRAPAAAPGAFYDPNQMNVAKKFFKRQRQHVARNRLELPPRRERDELPAREACIVTAGSKVNNTNIHVDADARRGPDPNLLPEDDYKCWSAAAAVVDVCTAAAEPRAPQQPAGTRTVSAQVSLDYSSSEPPRSGSALTPDSPSERAEPAPPAEPARPPGPEDGFENESDIYCPNYQVSEVSIRSHGLYAPSPASMCRGFSAEDVSPADSQYANVERAWRPPRSSPDSELDELYTRITSGPRAPPSPPSPPSPPALDRTAHSDVTLRPDSAGSEPRAETAV